MLNAITQFAILSICSFMPVKYIIACNTTPALCGVLINIVRYILLFSFGDGNIKDEEMILQVVIFYFISALIMVVNLIFLQVKDYI
jgi:hypothetical protein